MIPYFLHSVEKLDYNKQKISLNLTIANSTAAVEKVVLDWIEQYKSSYKNISYEINKELAVSKDEKEENRYLAKIKDHFLSKCLEAKNDYCFIFSSEIFLESSTLKILMEKNKPIIAPLLRPFPDLGSPFRNFFVETTDSGYYKESPDDGLITKRKKLGTFKADCVSAAYLINAKVLDKLSFGKGLIDWDCISFSKNAKKQGIDEYICNEKEFGFFLRFKEPQSLDQLKAFSFINPEMEVNRDVLNKILSPYFENNPSLEKCVSNFDLSKYVIFRVQNENLYYLDDVNDYIKNYILKQGHNWEDDIQDDFKKFVKPGSTVLDIGGHIGTHSLFLSKLVGDQGTVQVFEPQAKIFCELSINIYLNKCKNVKLNHLALGSEEKWIEMYIPAEAWTKRFDDDLINEGHGTVLEHGSLNGDKSKMTRLDNFNFNNVSLMKIDVEGFEMAVLQGGIETIKRDKPVIFIEIFINSETDKKIKFIESLGYKIYKAQGADHIFVPLENKDI